MTDKKTEHTLNNCPCGASDSRVILDLKPDKTQGYRAHCIWCGRSATWQDTFDEAIADWNRQAAAPHLLGVMKEVETTLSVLYSKRTDGGPAILYIVRAAIAKAEK